MVVAVARAAGVDEPAGSDAAGAAVEPAVRVQTAAELLEMLRARGVALPEGLVAARDGSVSVPAAEGEAGAGVGAGGSGEGAAVPAAAGGDVVPAGGNGDAAPGAAAGSAAAAEGAGEARWENRVELSFGLIDGNTESTTARVGYVGTRETEIDKLRLDSAYFFQSQSNETTENEAFGAFLYDRDITPTRWIWFSDGRLEWDEFESWDARVGTHAGLGYKVFDRERLKLVARAGAGAVREFGSERDEWIPEALAGADGEWRISDRQRLEASFRYFPDLEQGGEFRMVTSAGWVLDLDMRRGLNVNAGLLHEYQSVVDPGIERSDLRVYAGVGYGF